MGIGAKCAVHQHRILPLAQPIQTIVASLRRPKDRTPHPTKMKWPVPATPVAAGAPSRRRRSAEGLLVRQCALTGAGPVPRCRGPPAERRRIGVVEAAAAGPYRNGLIASRSA